MTFFQKKTDLRDTLETMARCPGMFAISREGFLMQISMLFSIMGINARPFMRVGAPRSLPKNVIPDLTIPIVTPHDVWAQKVVKKALSLLPKGVKSVEFSARMISKDEYLVSKIMNS